MASPREAYAEIFIQKITPADYRVCISGFIVSKKDNSFILDDGTGQILVQARELPPSDFIRVFGRTQPLESGFALEADIIQDFSSVNKELLKRVKELLQQQ